MGLALKPALHSIVIVCCSIYDGILVEVVRGVRVARQIFPEGEQQDLHTWEAKPLHYLTHIRCDHAQIFSQNRKGRKLFYYGGEEVFRGRLRPLPMDRGGLSGRDLPTGDKSSKVVQPDFIEKPHVVLDALDPPGVLRGFKRVPPVNRISPELAGCAEIVRRDSGDNGWTLLVVEFENFRVGPDISAVVVHVDRQVADHKDVFPVAVLLERSPLFEKEVLEKLLFSNLFLTTGFPLAHRLLLPISQLLGPVAPALFAEGAS